MAEMFEGEDLNFDETAYVERWAPQVAANWQECYGAATFGKLGSVLHAVARLKEAQATAERARLQNAIYIRAAHPEAIVDCEFSGLSLNELRERNLEPFNRIEHTAEAPVIARYGH